MIDEGHIADLARASDAAARENGVGGRGMRLPNDLAAILSLEQAGMEASREASEWVSARMPRDADALRRRGIVFDMDEAWVSLDAPIQKPGKVMAIGLNYAEHARESDQPLPERPVVFTKAPTCVIGPEQPVHVPHESERVDWEGELCVVIGRSGRRIPRQSALEYVAGYMNSNDVSVRDWQRHAPTWTMGKGFDTHGPTGPYLVTRGEAPDPPQMVLRLWVNDVLKQESSVDDLIFDVPALIEYLSTAMTLEPGDLIFTGTPSGVGAGRRPQEWLRAGDTVRVAITGLGELRNPVVAESR